MGLYSGSLFEFVAVRALVGEELGSESYPLSSGFHFCYLMDFPGTHHLFYHTKPQLCALFLDIIDLLKSAPERHEVWSTPIEIGFLEDEYTQ